jgi:hypothetical protein
MKRITIIITPFKWELIPYKFNGLVKGTVNYFFLFIHVIINE